MSMTDPIADFLSRIRNAIMARHNEVVAPASRVKANIAKLLKEEGFIVGYDVRTDGSSFDQIVVTLKWPNHTTNAITGLRRRSRPGQRVYVRQDNIPRVRSGMGVAILSTSIGVMTDRAARRAGVGGELICEVW